MQPIEKEHPIPDRNPTGKKYPFSDMEIGDSVFFEGGNLQRPIEAMKSTSRRYGRKFCRRRMNGGVRIWRVE